jgi:hypothetical protein
MRRSSGYDWYPCPRAPTSPPERRKSSSSGAKSSRTTITPTELALMNGRDEESYSVNDGMSRHLPNRRSIAFPNVVHGDYLTARPMPVTQTFLVSNSAGNDGLSTPSPTEWPEITPIANSSVYDGFSGVLPVGKYINANTTLTSNRARKVSFPDDLVGD